MWISIFIIIVLIAVGSIFYYNKDSLKIKIEKVCEVSSTKTLSGGWWFTISGYDDSKLKEYGITLPEVDFNLYNLVISDGREIKEISFKRDSSFPFKKTHFADVLFGKELHTNTWFVYKIDKINIYPDERSGEVKIEK